MKKYFFNIKWSLMMNENNKKSLPSTLRKTMNLFSKRNILFFVLLVLLLTASSCKNEYPDSIFNPDETYKPDPVITDIVSANSLVLAGVDTLTIVGKNFSTNVQEDLVYFDGELAQVISATTTSMRVVPPNVPGDSIDVKLNVHGALQFADYSPFRLDSAFVPYLDFGKFDIPYPLTTDANENVYVSMFGKTIIKVSPSREKSDYLTNAFTTKASGMKIGPDGSLFYVNVIQFLIRIPPGGGSNELYATLPGGVADLDFDADHNIYCAGSGGAIYKVAPDKSVSTVKDSLFTKIFTLRVFDGYVYYAGEYVGNDPNHAKKGVWRNKILPSGISLGETELVFDWVSNFSLDLDINAITFSADGDMLIGTNSPEGIIVVSSSGNFHPLYPNVFKSFFVTDDPTTEVKESAITSFAWGTGTFLYAIRKYTILNKSTNAETNSSELLRFQMRKLGAPYYGFQ